MRSVHARLRKKGGEVDMKVVLSTALLLEEGRFDMKRLTLDEAKQWVRENAPKNFCGHQTAKLLGLVPAATREECRGYQQALVLKPNGRLEFGKEYSLAELDQIGVTPYLITRL